jgi:hypothetical protein
MAYIATCVLIQHKLSLSQSMFCLEHTPFDLHVGFIVSVKLHSSFLCSGHVHFCCFCILTWFGSALIVCTLHHSSHHLLLLLLNCASVLGCSCSLFLSLNLLYLYTANSAMLTVSFCYVYALGLACLLILFV